MPLAPYFLIALSFIGIADTAYLSYFAYLNAVPGCAIGGCEQVLTSVYSKFYGIPLAYIGLVYYLGMLGLAILLAIKPWNRLFVWAAALYTLVGFLLSLYFEFYIQGTLIGTYCMYCAISALTTLGLFTTAVLHFRNLRKQDLFTPNTKVGESA